jgi:glyoxylase-like metal-dependent hydrolase (beta-lactamase superfamily II)
MEIFPNVHVIKGSVSNCYLILDNNRLTLIDTGLPRDRNKILNYIRSLGQPPQGLERIIITHADGDHVGSLAAIQTLSGARTYRS